MENCLYLRGEDFKETNFSYSESVSPDCKMLPYRNKYRISFMLPNGERDYYYRLEPHNYKSPKTRRQTLNEFDSLVRTGHFPEKSIAKLEKFQTRSTQGNTTFFDALEKYYTVYNKGRYFKRPTNINNQRPTLTYLLKLLQKKTGKKYLDEITTDDLMKIEDRLQDWCAENGKAIGIVTTASYKRMMKSYFNCLAKKMKLNMNPSVISSNPETNGHENEAVGARTVIIPEDLLEAVDKFPYTTPYNYPDRKEMTHLYNTTGLAKAEMSTLSEENLYPDKYNFDSLILMDKLDCPTNLGTGFQVKTHNRHKRIVPLDDRGINFIHQQMDKHKGHEIFGRISVKDGENIYKSYRFLFPVLHHGKWQRCDDFLRGIQTLFDDASKYFNLGYNGRDYTVHDFRNTLNERMGDLGISAEDRAYILGHSKEVNEKNYMNADKRKELRARMAHASFRRKMLNKDKPKSPAVAKRPRLRLVADN